MSFTYNAFQTQSSPVHAVPTNFTAAPEHAQVVSLVKGSIDSINDIIEILNHPVDTKFNTGELEYALESVKAFKLATVECRNSLGNASVVASAWFTSIGTQLATTSNDLERVQTQIATAESQIAQNVSLIETNFRAVKDLVKGMEQEHRILEQAENQYSGARGAFFSYKIERSDTQALSWMPLVAMTLSVVDVLNHQYDIQSFQTFAGQTTYDRTSLNAYGDQLKGQRQMGLKLHAELSGLHTQEAELRKQQAKLQDYAQYLGPLKINIEHCIRAVSAALANSTTPEYTGEFGSIDMEKLRRGIKCLVEALQGSAEFQGAFATMDSRGCAQLDRRIKALRNSPKPMISRVSDLESSFGCLRVAETMSKPVPREEPIFSTLSGWDVVGMQLVKSKSGSVHIPNPFVSAPDGWDVVGIQLARIPTTVHVSTQQYTTPYTTDPSRDWDFGTARIVETNTPMNSSFPSITAAPSQKGFMKGGAYC